MGAINEKAANRGRVSIGITGFEGESSDHRNSQGSVGQRGAPIQVCGGSELDEGCDFSGGQPGLGGASRAGSDPDRVRKSHGNPAGAPSFHSQEMVQGRQGSDAGMKTTTVANQKGGVGKTATTVHLAHAALELGKRVVVIDLDPQANASTSLSAYTSPLTSPELFQAGVDIQGALASYAGDQACLAVISGADALANLEKFEWGDVAPVFKSSLQSIAEMGFDVCIIDTPPTIGNAMASALFASDFVLSPIEPEQFSMDGIRKMGAVITNMRPHNPGLQFLGMVPNMVDRRNEDHTANLKALYESFPALMLPPIYLGVNIARAVTSGIPVWKSKKTAARKDAKHIKAVAQYVFDKMEIAQ